MRVWQPARPPHHPGDAPFTASGLRTRPWAIVRDADGFPQDEINHYLTYAAWQDAPPRRVRTDAHHLADAAAWLARWDESWASADVDLWALYGHELQYYQGHRDPQPVYRMVETLHRAYAFWHWQDPQTIRWQPFPTSRTARRAWIAYHMALF